MQSSDSNAAFIKAPKRKRLAKACDACHRSKRRCDGTAPCSNCYYASKQCTYTDASGRAVPAPRPFKPERLDPQSSSSSDAHPHSQSHYGASSNQFRIYPHQATSQSHQFQNDNSDDDNKHNRKRVRHERGGLMPVDELVIEGPITSVVRDRAAPDLDPSLTRELTNLFFAHCNPARTVIHKPTFSSSLSHNRVPSHLLLAVCALAAPLSKQPRIRTAPARFAGRPFAQEALSQMFDGAGRLVVEPNLATAQALCILQMHDILTKERNALWSSRFHELALQIVESLGVHRPDHPMLTPVPSQEFVQASIERESVRRIFWLIHVLDVLASIYFKKPTTFADVELRLRLPVDETSFELGVHSTLPFHILTSHVRLLFITSITAFYPLKLKQLFIPEYLYLPAVRTQYASEFGHLIRILSVYAKMECVLDEASEAEINSKFPGVIADAEQELNEWERTLPEHLRFSEQNLQVQRSMFETSSNTGAWCWCSIHVYHASCAMALYSARHRAQRGTRYGPQWAVERIESILQLLGDRAKNSILMGSALWSLIKYCKRDDTLVRDWASEYEEAAGTNVFDLVQDWRSQPSPPLRHVQHPPHFYSQNQSQQQQLHTHALDYNSQSAPSNRRLSDVHNPIPESNVIHKAATSYDGTEISTHIVKRSPSQTPLTYPLGRSSNSTDNKNDIASSRSLSMSQHHGSMSDAQSSGISGVKDARYQSSAGSVAVPPFVHLEHGSKNEEPSSFKNQKPANTGTYDMREAEMQPRRWADVANNPASTKMDEDKRHGYPSSVLENVAGSSTAILSGTGKSSNLGQDRRASIVSGDGTQSLPSLKASGLLESWGASRSHADAVSGQKLDSRVSPRTMSPARSNVKVTPSHHPLHHSDGTDLRPPSLAMPVGMPWLANESR